MEHVKYEIPMQRQVLRLDGFMAAASPASSRSPATSGKAHFAPRSWRVADIELDEARSRLLVAGREVPLQRVPLALLRVLLGAAPQVLSHADLLERVWKRAPAHVSRNVLSNAVARLREAVGDPEGRLIVCRPGIGYCVLGVVRQLTQDAGDASPAPPPPTDAEPYMMALWTDALRGHSLRDPQLNLYDVLREGTERAERELAEAPLALAHFHRTLAGHCLGRLDYTGAIGHLRRALAVAGSLAKAPVPDAVLQLHFDLSRVLASNVFFDARPDGLLHARRELLLAQAGLRRSPQAGPSTQLSARWAAWCLAYFEDDWGRSVDLAHKVLQLAESVPGVEAGQWWVFRYYHASTLMWSGQTEQAVQSIEGLFRDPSRPLPSHDVIHKLARVVQGNIYAVTGRPAQAVAVLEPLFAELSQAGQASAPAGIMTARWLAEGWSLTGRAAAALDLLRSAHAHALVQRGASSEMALQVLQPLARLLADAGERPRALSLLETAVGPRLAQLAMPGQRYAVLCLARWVELLIEARHVDEAGRRLRQLRPRDLRAALLRPEEAQAFWLRCRRALEPATASPRVSIAQLDGSGTGAATPRSRLSSAKSPVGAQLPAASRAKLVVR